MPQLFERTALILLATTALTTASAYAQAPAADAAPAPLLAIAPAADSAVAATGEDAAARAKGRESSSTYTVRKGDTLAEIADRMNVTIEAVAKANGLKKPYRLQPGQKLKNPKAAKAAPAARAPKAASGASSGGTYTVKSGDTLFAIAQRNGTTVEALRAANGMGRSTSLVPGRKLKLPGGANEPEVGETPEEDAELAERMANAASPRNEPRAPSASEATGERVSTERQVTGRVVSIDVPGKAYKVKKGDTLERVANRLDSDVAELARLNKLKKPYRLQPGQTIRGPGTSAKGYVVGRGDTIAEIAQRFSVTEAQLRSANGLRRGASVAPGRRLRLPAGYRDRGPITTTVRMPEAPPRTAPPPTFETPTPRQPPPRPTQGVLPDQPQPYRPSPGVTPGSAQPYRPSPGVAPGQTPFPRTGPVAGAPVASPPVSDAQISEMGRGLFVWPIQGQVISGFGGRGQGPRNDGLNIRANAGDAVRSAASGEVVYAGDQVPGFGNLVLIKHADGWVTAYGHLSRIEVRMQQKVTQGQSIGQAGTTGGVSEPQLHFEVRYAPTPQERARPVDPALVLPR